MLQTPGKLGMLSVRYPEPREACLTEELDALLNSQTVVNSEVAQSSLTYIGIQTHTCAHTHPYTQY